jgi:multidrug efflux pump subunit AcrA (membrane-fusion protein)
MMEIDNRTTAEEIEEEDLEFEEALRTRTRRRWMLGGVTLALIAALLIVPWSESVELTGRVAPGRWARVRSEAPGVVREVRRRSGDLVQEGDVIAVLDSDEQRDAVEGARLALTRERQKLADLELRLRENSILREGAEAAVRDAERRAAAAARIEEARFTELEPASASVLEGVREFTIKARDQVAIAASSAPPFPGDQVLQAIEAAMARYVERAKQIAAHLSSVAGEEAGRDLTARLENVRFSFGLAESSMREIVRKHEFVTRGLLAPAELRGLVNGLEHEGRDLEHSFEGLASAARGWKGSPVERREWVRSAEEKRQLLANETQRVEAERETVASGIAQAELAVRAAERNEGKTAIHAPISGTLAESALAELDGVAANAPVGVVEDANQVVLKVHVLDVYWPRVAEGQAVNANVNGRVIRGTVAWKVPRLGQEVRDQQWNVLIRLDGDVAGVQPGTKVNGAVGVGWRSLLWRWIDRHGPDTASASGSVFIDDPTEQRSSGAGAQLAARESRTRATSDTGGLVNGSGEY